MDASFSIQMNAGAKGAKASEPSAFPAPSQAPRGSSFGKVMVQAGNEASATDLQQAGHTRTDLQQPDAKKLEQISVEDSAKEGLLTSLQLALAWQGAAAAPAHSGQAGPDSQATASSEGGQPASADHILGMVQTPSSTPVDPAGMLTLTPSVAPATPDVEGTMPASVMPAVEPALPSLTPAAQPAGTDTPAAAELGESLEEGAVLQPRLPSAQPARSSPIDAAGRAAAEAAVAALSEQPAQEGSDKAGDPDQQASPIVTVPDGGESTPPPPTDRTAAQGRHAALNAERPGTEGNEGAGSYASEGGSGNPGRPQEAILQDPTLRDHGQQLSTAARDERAASPDRKDPAGSSPAPSERLAVMATEPRIFRPDEIVKAAAVAPMTPPAEPAGSVPVQALSLEVDRPDLGQVALRVVLADQTVHAKVTTDHADVRDFLVARQGQLESGLKANGLEMGEFRVEVNQHRQPQSDSGWLGSYRDAWGQGRQQAAHQATASQDGRPADRWSGEAESAAGARPSRGLSVFA